MKNKLYLFLSAVVVMVLLSCSQKADWEGMPAPNVPEQNTTDLPAPFRHEDYTIKPLANYTITAIVFSTERYSFDKGAVLSPLDLLLGWKRMSAADVINQFEFSQSGRRGRVTTKGEHYPIPKKEVDKSIANTHCVPASNAIKKKLLKLKKYDLITMKGYLVEIRGKNFVWRSSLTRDDVGGGACEVLWVTDVSKMAKI
ncbi:hypothetical protein LJC22_01725 [Desulfosarcina sp. OttesenSCG-928-G10]|nr:hypothetical protein [Desulfosarcina sp. OttesenSCG-928-G10]MDL2322294.1 hypothetical protein [Desulfosarcina sp. OttesenSCG-928-B08]